MPVNLPNAITILRILLVPFTVWLITSGANMAAFAVFLLAGLSDAVDGYLARKFGAQTELGAYLDPIADKALLVSIYVALAITGVMPAWLAILVATRDVLIVGAVVLARLMERPLAMKPLWVSKLNTTAQIVYAGVALGFLAFQLNTPFILTISIVSVAVLTILSGGLYMRAWVRHMSGPLSQEATAKSTRETPP
jgi:cardiolipin synthase (CMP-forming)